MKAIPLTVYLPDTRGVTLSRFGCGNRKLGFGVFTYSRRAGQHESCPGATDECENICYAKRIAGPVLDVYSRNSATDDVPEIPAECKILRIHVSGDFDTPEYILNWVARLKARPDVTCWAYTRSWRCHSLLEFLEELRKLPNVQLFASMDPSTRELPPAGWRRAWIYRDYESPQATVWPTESRLVWKSTAYSDVRSANEHHALVRTGLAKHNGTSYVCPEETGRKADCLACGYCFEGQKHDVTFLEH